MNPSRTEGKTHGGIPSTESHINRVYETRCLGEKSTSVQGGLRRIGLTPALAPRMPEMTKDVGKSRPQTRQYCQGVHKKLIVFE